MPPAPAGPPAWEQQRLPLLLRMPRCTASPRQRLLSMLASNQAEGWHTSQQANEPGGAPRSRNATQVPVPQGQPGGVADQELQEGAGGGAARAEVPGRPPRVRGREEDRQRLVRAVWGRGGRGPREAQVCRSSGSAGVCGKPAVHAMSNLHQRKPPARISTEGDAAPKPVQASAGTATLCLRAVVDAAAGRRAGWTPSARSVAASAPRSRSATSETSR